MKKQIRVIDKRKREKFMIDDVYIDEQAYFCGWKGTIAYISLCRHVNKDQICFPSLELMAKQHGVSQPTITAGLKSLEKNNVIKIEKKKTLKGKWLNNTYVLLDKTEWDKIPLLKKKRKIKKKASTKGSKALHTNGASVVLHTNGASSPHKRGELSTQTGRALHTNGACTKETYIKETNKRKHILLSAHGAEEHFSSPSDKDLPMVKKKKKKKKEKEKEKEKTLLEKKKEQEKTFLNELDKIETTEENEPTPKDISEAISFFLPVLPTYFITHTPFAIPATRKIIKNVLKLYTKEQLKDIVDKYHAKTRDMYRPSVATVYEFCTKLDKIKSYVEKTSSNLWAHKSISTPEQKAKFDIAIKARLAETAAKLKVGNEEWHEKNPEKSRQMYPERYKNN